MGKAGQEAKKRRKLRERFGINSNPYDIVKSGHNGGAQARNAAKMNGLDEEHPDLKLDEDDDIDDDFANDEQVKIAPGVLLSLSDLATASRVLSVLAATHGALGTSAPAAKDLKPLRRAVHDFVRAETAAAGAGSSLSSRVSLALSSGRFVDAQVLLAEMTIRKTPVKLGAIQRWVRECDAAGTASAVSAEHRADIWKALEWILRATGGGENRATSADGGAIDFGVPTDEYGKGAEVWKRAVWAVGDPSGDLVWTDRENGTLVSPEEAEQLRTNFRVVLHTPGPERRPPNEHPAVIWTSNPGSVPIKASDPVERLEHPFVPGCFVLKGVLSREDCRTILKNTEAVGYIPDKPIGSKDDSILAHNVYWLADKEFMTALWARVGHLLPPTVDGGKLRGINPRFRCYRYVPGAVYRPHIDGAWPESGLDEQGNYVYDLNANSPVSVWSRLTFLVYLNDDFTKGHTTYFIPRDGPGIDAHPVAPRMGSVVVFPHGEARGSLLHEGSGVGQGAKLIIRTDVLYEVVGKEKGSSNFADRVDGN